MRSSDLLGMLKLLANPLNMDILVLLGTKKSYPRELARILGKDETLISRRLRALEKAGLVKARWTRLPSGKNVRIYEVAIPELRISFKPEGGEHKEYRELLFQSLRMRLPEQGLVIGRKRELRLVEGAAERIVVIWGLPGIGKTTLAARLAREAEVPVYWHSCSEVDDPEYVAWRLSLFLAGLGARETLRYMDKPGYSIRVVLDILSRDLDKIGAVLIFDDYQAVEARPTGAFIRRLAENLRSSRIILVSRKRPGKLPYHEGRVLEVRLDTLEVREVEEMLRAHGLQVEPEKLAQIYAATMGHPLALKLYIASVNIGVAPPLPLAHSRIIEYLWRELMSRLSERHRRIVAGLAPFTEPQPVELIGLLAGIGNPEPYLLELMDQGVVEKYGDHYRIHGLLRTLVERSRWADAYRVAARYYYSQGGWHGLFHAMKYLLEAEDPSEAARLVCERIMRDEYGYIFSMNSYEEVLERMPTALLPQGLKACILHDKALLLRARGELKKSLTLFEQALKLAENPVVRASVLERIGFILAENGRYKEAEEKLKEALMIAEEHEADNPKLLYGVYADLAKMAGEAGRLEEAERYLKEEVRIAGRIDDYFYRAMAVIHLANIYLWEGRVEEALRLLEPLRGDLEAYGNTFLQGSALLVLTEAYLKSHRYDDALWVSGEALRLLGSIGYELRRASILYMRSKALMRLGHLDKALRTLVEALRHTCETGSAWLLREAAEMIGEICVSIMPGSPHIGELASILKACVSREELAGLASSLRDKCLGRV